MEFSIGKLSESFELSTEALRYYERKGLLSPKRRDGSTFRVYEFLDVVRISTIKRYQNMGLSLEEICRLYEPFDLKGLLECVEEKHDALKAEIAFKQALSERMDDIIKRMEKIDGVLLKPELISGGTYCVAEYRDSEHMAKSLLKDPAIRKLFAKMPITSTTSIIPRAMSEGHGGEIKRGVVFEERFAPLLKLPKQSEKILRRITAERFVRCAFLLINGAYRAEELMEVAAPFVRENGLTVCDDMFTIQLLNYCNDDGENYHYTDLMIPVE
ncbi:MAG: MerR family transcriptional regulator [Oscillospiraceae bacterium]